MNVLGIGLLVLLAAGCATHPILLCLPATLTFNKSGVIAEGFVCGEKDMMADRVNALQNSPEPLFMPPSKTF